MKMNKKNCTGCEYLLKTSKSQVDHVLPWEFCLTIRVHINWNMLLPCLIWWFRELQHSDSYENSRSQISWRRFSYLFDTCNYSFFFWTDSIWTKACEIWRGRLSLTWFIHWRIRGYLLSHQPRDKITSTSIISKHLTEQTRCNWTRTVQLWSSFPVFLKRPNIKRVCGDCHSLVFTTHRIPGVDDRDFSSRSCDFCCRFH